MDILNEWMGKTIEQELGEVLEWRNKSDENRSQVTGTVRDLTFDDDGSNLRIRSARPRIVQIIKFMLTDEPLQASLSDSVNRVNATIAKEAVQRHGEQHKKRLTEGTIGGLIQLIDFEIVATHIGSRQRRLTLFVTDFKSIGSNGSGEYGVPQAIEDRQQIGELIQKLIDFRRRESASSRVPSRQERTSRASSVMSQPSNISSQEEPGQASQIFATQVPPQKKRISIQKTKVSSNGIDNHGALGRTASNISNLTGNGTTGIGFPQLPQALASPKPLSSNGKKSLATASEELLSLLPSTERTSKQVASKYLTSAQQSLSPNFSHNIGTSTDLMKPMLPPTAIASKTRDVPQHRDDRSLRPSSPRTTVEEHSAKPIIAAARTAPSKPGSKTISRNRITSRDVKIPKDQEDILDSVDSWVPAEPGKRDPVANIPISILHTLNRNADLRAKRSAMVRVQETHVTLPSELKSVRRSPSRLESDSDAPISSSEWPASPDGNQLPPDSSAGSVDLVQVAVGSLSRTSPSTSGGSRAVPPSPLQSIESPTISGEASPSLLSQNLASASVGEGGQLFKCGAVGCNKLFGNPGSLKKHMKRNHSDKRLEERTNSHTHSCEKSHKDSNCFKYNILYDHQDEGSRASDSRGGTPASIASQFVTSGSAEMRSSTSNSSESTKKHVASNRDQTSAYPKVNGRDYPKVNGRECSLEDVELQVQHSRTNLASPGPASTPDLLVQPSQVESASKDINHIDNGVDNRIDEPLSLRSRTPSPSSDIEISATIPLNDQTRSFTNRVPLQDLPSTAPQELEPYLQVKRTPYVNGHIHNHSPPSSELQLSPSKLKLYPSMHDALEEVDHITQSASSVQETSSSETRASRLNDVRLGEGQNVENGQISVSAFGGVAVPGVQLETGPELHEPHEERTSLENSTAISSGTIPESMLLFGKGSEVSSKSDFIDADEKVKIAETTQSKTSTFDSPGTFHTETELAQGQAMKRKAPEMSLLSPNVSKRKKMFKVPAAFAFTERVEDRRDPVEGARRYREDFMASRRSSEGSTPIGSPTMLSRSPTKQPLISSMKPWEPELQNNDPEIEANHATLPQDPLATDNSMEIDREFSKPTTQLLGFDIEVDDAGCGLLKSPPTELDNANTNFGGQDDASVMYELDNHVDSETFDTNNRQPETDGQVARLVESLADPQPSHVQEDLPEASSPPKTPLFEADMKIREPVAHSPNQTDTDTSMPDAHKDQTYNFESKIALVQSESNIQPTHSSKSSPPLRTPTAPCSGPKMEVEVRSHIAPEEPSSIPLLDSELKEPIVIAPLMKAEQRLPSVPQSTFDLFKTTYPTYPGDMKHFIAICKKISSLEKLNRMPHQALWDDFIVRHKTEYAQHLRHCAEDAEDALPYEVFYHTEIEVPLCRSRIITRTNLEEVLSNAGPKASETKRQCEHEMPLTSLTKSSTSTEQYEYENSRTPPVRSLKSRSSFEPVKSRRQVQTPIKKPITIDLTQDDHDNDLGKMPEKSWVDPRIKITTKTRRSLPWSEVSTDHKAKTIQRSSGELDEIGLSFNPSGDSSSTRVKPPSIIKETRSKRTSDQLSRSRVELTDGTENEDSPGEWWQDENTPFKCFARAYNSIRPGNGNSYAKSEPTNVQPRSSRRKKKVARMDRRVDPLDWEL